MTAQPTQDQLRALALRKDADAHQPDNHTPDLCGDPECVPTCVVDGVEWPCETAWLRDQLAAAEQRIRDLTQEVRDERGAARDQMEQVRIRDARIKAVRELHSESRIIPDTPVFGCAECGEPNETEPCATIRALEG